MPLLQARHLAISTLIDDRSLTPVSHLYGAFETTGPRDSVFAQKNINPSLKSLEPRYEDSLEKVLMDATLAVLQTTRKWHYFAPPKHFQPGHVPSWIIDFTSDLDAWRMRPMLYNSALGATLRVRFEQANSLVTAACLASPVLWVSNQATYHRPYSLAAERLSMLASVIRDIAGMMKMPFDATDPNLLRTICADSFVLEKVGLPRRSTEEDLSPLHSMMSKARSHFSSEDETDQWSIAETLDDDERRALFWICTRFDSHAIGITKDGQYGWFPKDAMNGDVVAVLAGSTLPVILRESGTRSGQPAYRYIGVSYIHGE